jgi:hypothetical protein
MAHNLQMTIPLLSRTPAVFDRLLRGMPEEWTHRNEGDGTFTAVDVVGHLVYADQHDWIPRASMILECGEAKPFDRWGHVEECRGQALPHLLDRFAKVRTECLEILRELDLRPDQLELRGRHPSLGAVTLSELLATWAAHDLTHMHQVSRIMAHQYRELVGPFGAFLGVLNCNGHGG